MENSLKVLAIQVDIRWHDGKSNRQTIEQLLDSQKDLESIDLIVLPEMFTSGFTMKPTEVAETMSDATIQWMLALADQYDTAVTGTLAIRETQNFYNRLIWATPNNHIQYYDKRHLFTLAGEHHQYTAGEDKPIFSWRDWRIRPITCYDLRFPVWCRRTPDDYDLLICPANWPSPRHQAWVTLLHARAIENQSYLVGVNRVGEDANEKRYLGSTLILDAKGSTLADAGSVQGVISATLDKQRLEKFREKFPVGEDADSFQLI